MTKFALLLKKQFQEDFASRGSLKKKLSSAALTLILTVGIVVICGFILFKFSKSYLQIKFNRVPDISGRQFELLSIIYFALMVALTLSGLGKLCHRLFEDSDIEILLSLPYTSLQIFFSKLVRVYISEVLISFVSLITINSAVFAAAETNVAYGVLMPFVLSFFMPIIPLGIAGIFALPFYILKKTLSSKNVLHVLVILCLLVGCCTLYALLFEKIGDLIASGNMSALANENAMLKITNFAKFAYPANLFASIMLQKDVLISIGIFLGIALLTCTIGTLIVRFAFLRVAHYGAPSSKEAQGKPHNYILRGKILGLLSKEFLMVARTPNYAYMCFGAAIVTPLLAYYMAKTGSTMLMSLFGDIDAGFEICTISILMFLTLTNTFCSTSVSRDGYMAFAQKALPYTPSQTLISKVIFALLIALPALASACIAYSLTGLESAEGAAITFVAGTLMSLAQISFATRLDLARPHFAESEGGEVKEANSTISLVILLGLVACFVIGILLVNNKLTAFLTSSSDGKTAAYSISVFIPLGLAIVSGIFFFANLKKAYTKLGEGM